MGPPVAVPPPQQGLQGSHGSQGSHGPQGPQGGGHGGPQPGGGGHEPQQGGGGQGPQGPQQGSGHLGLREQTLLKGKVDTMAGPLQTSRKMRYKEPSGSACHGREQEYDMACDEGEFQTI